MEAYIPFVFGFLILLVIGGFGFVIFYPVLSDSAVPSKRMKLYIGAIDKSPEASLGRMKEQGRRKAIEETLKDVDERRKKGALRLPLRVRLEQAGIKCDVKMFYIYSTGVAFFAFFIFWGLGTDLYVALGAAFAGFAGLPLWLVKFLRNRRQGKFLNKFADAVDTIIRGVKSGLPLHECLRTIATDMDDPIGPEFYEVVESAKVGVTLSAALERLYDRMPLLEVHFFINVIIVQQKVGGNLSEALGNLSVVLRGRRQLKAKIKSVSQEAKTSAMIIGSLPFLVMGGLHMMSPDYLIPLWETELGHIMLAGAAMWMGCGIFVMRKMINFDF